MQVTITGIVLMSLGLLAFLWKPKSLYSFLVFFIPFSATAVVNVAKGSSGSCIQATMFFGSLYMLVIIIKSFATQSFYFPKGSRNPLNYLFLYLLVALVSICTVPFILEGQIVIESASLQKKNFMDYAFSFGNITQFVYLLYGVLLVVAIIHHNQDEKALNQTLKIYIMSALFITLWGVMQYGCNKVGIQYPYQVFNNSMSDFAKGYLGEVNGSKRISSVAVEPSMFAKHLLTVIPLVFFSVIGKRPIWSPLMDKVTLAIMVGVLLLSTSSTGYVGLVFVTFVSLLMIFILKEFRLSYYLNFTVILVLVGILFALSTYMQNMVDDLIINKFSSYSGQERTNGVTLAWGYFLQSPILGLGWGTVTSQDLIVNILSNTGFVGLLVMALFFIVVIGKIIQGIQYLIKRNPASPKKYLAAGVFVSMMTELFTSAITGFPYVFSNFWFLIALTLTVSALIEKDRVGSLRDKGGALHENRPRDRVLSARYLRGRGLHL